jgi:hypothetical protein
MIYLEVASISLKPLQVEAKITRLTLNVYRCPPVHIQRELTTAAAIGGITSLPSHLSQKHLKYPLFKHRLAGPDARMVGAPCLRQRNLIDVHNNLHIGTDHNVGQRRSSL